MAANQNPPPPGGSAFNPNIDPSEVRFLDEMAIKWSNINRLKKEANKADEAHRDVYKEIVKLQGQEAKNSKDYKTAITFIEQLEKNLETYRASGNKKAQKRTQQLIDAQKAQAQALMKTTGGALRAQEIQASKRKAQLETEKNLIEKINKERAKGNTFGKVGLAIADLFRSKEAKQRQIDLARAKAGGGANVPPGTGGDTAGAAGAGAGGRSPLAAAALLVADKIKKVFSSLGNMAGQWASMGAKAITAPFADAAQLLTGEDYGMGGGKVKATGPSSILGGMQEFAKSIPIIGGLLGSLVGILKTIVEGIFGIEQGVFRFARAMNLSYGAADRMKSSFNAIAASSGHIAINSTRMMQSQVEIGTQLGINKQLSADILKNDVLLRDVVGTEAEIRQSIANTSITAGKNAIKLTQSIIGTVGAFNKLVGTSYTFNGIMKEASKLSGVIGLAFAKYPEKIAKTLMITKSLGFELQQLDGVGSSLLDFESSISKEMEAQVLTGKDMNLVKAREAALNNDYATLSKEIAKNVGSADEFLGMQRIKQEAIAESVGMTANSLADVLKKQQLYGTLGADDLKTFHQKIELLEKQGKTQEQISALIGKDAYNAYTQISTAERITEILETMKRTFVELIKSSGIFDFITKPDRMINFVKKMADVLAGAIDMTGRVIASLMEGVAYIVSWFSDQKAQEIRSLATQIRSGTGTFAGSIRTATGTMGGTPAPSVGATTENTARQQAQAEASGRTSRGVGRGEAVKNATANINVALMVDKDVLAKTTVEAMPEQWQTAFT